LIDEILLINKAGLPIYFYDRYSPLKSDDDASMLKAGFFSAITQFAREMADDEIKYVVSEKKSHVLMKASGILIVLTELENDESPDLKKIEKDVLKTSEFAITSLNEEGVDDFDYIFEDKLKTFVNGLNEFFIKEEIIEKEASSAEPSQLKMQARGFIFRTVGYKPGQCNIGNAERMRRLVYGLTGVVLTLLVFLIIDAMALPREMRLILFIPLFLAFQGIYQYFFRFCVANALKKQYNMS